MPKEYTDRDHEITARIGEDFSVALPANPTTGYEWVPEFDATMLQLTDRQFSSSGAQIGAGGVERFRFKALTAGDAYLRLIYKRSWEAISAKVVSIHVHIKN